jgi:hypothetical protein
MQPLSVANRRRRRVVGRIKMPHRRTFREQAPGKTRHNVEPERADRFPPKLWSRS